jgi:predicted transcriptional regulator
MEVRLKPETEARLNELAAASGRSPDDLLQDAMAGYLKEVAETREMLDTRYDETVSGRVEPVDGEQSFARLRSKSQDRRSARRSAQK